MPSPPAMDFSITGSWAATRLIRQPDFAGILRTRLAADLLPRGASDLVTAISSAFVTEWDFEKFVSPRRARALAGQAFAVPESADVRRYVVMEAKRRLHQSLFRELVIEAYESRCAVRGLGARSASGQQRHCDVGNPSRRLQLRSLGIDPNGRLHVNRDFLEIHDGPLTKSLQDLDAGTVTRPVRQDHRPNRDFLAERFEQFLRLPDATATCSG